MKTFTNLAHRAFKKCASLGTTNRNRYYLFSIIMLLTLGAGTAWGETYELVTSISDLEAGAKYIVGNSASTSSIFMSTATNTNNRKVTSAITITDNKVTITEDVLILELGGETGAWTFKTTNYLGTQGFLTSAASGKNNHCKVVATAESCSYFTIAFNDQDATITSTGRDERNILRYNSSNGGLFACYSSGQDPVYLYKLTTSSGGDEGGTEEPALSVKPQKVDFGTKNIYVESEKQGSLEIDITGQNLTGNVTATITEDDDNVFSLSSSSFAPNAGEVSEKLTVSYEVSEENEYSATLTLSSAGVEAIELPITLTIVNKKPTVYTKVTDAATLSAGDKVILVYETDKKAAGAFPSGKGYLEAIDITQALNTTATPATASITDEAVVEYTLGGTTGAWELISTAGKLSEKTANTGSSVDLKANGDTKWTISITEGNATIEGSDNTIKYNTTYSRFKTYNSGQAPIQLYAISVPKYAVNFTQPEGGELIVKNGETAITSGDTFAEGIKLTVTATPANGYEGGTVVVKDAVGNDVTATVYADGVLTMPAYAVTISATFDEKPCELLVTPTVSAETTYSSATLTWEAVANAAKYSVKVGTAEAVETTETSYEVTGLNAETEYTYQVQAIAEAEQDTYCDSEVAEGSFTTTAAPVATLTLSDIEGTTTKTGALNGTITLPTTAAECSKTFVGWDADENCDHAPTYARGAEYTFTTLEPTLYAVYADGEAGEALQWTIKNDDLKVLDSSQSSGYAKYAGDQEKDGVTFNITSVMPATGENDGKIQMQARKATIYNKTAMPGNIISIAIDGVDLSVYEGTEVISSTPSSGAITKNSEVYNFSSGKRYFHLKKSTESAGYANSITVTYASAPTYSNYSTTCAAAPKAEVNPTEVTATAAGVEGKVTVTYENVNTENVAIALFNDEACTEAFTADWLTASLDGDKNITYTVAATTLYTERKAYIQLTAPETTGATDPDVVVIPVTQAAKEKVFASLAELVAADLTAGDEVTVTLNNDVIKEFYIYNSNRAGVVFDVQKDGKDIKIYFNNQTTIVDWAVGGKLSGTLTNVKWTTYSSAWQLAPDYNTWAWANLTYTEPKAVSTVIVSGAPTKTTYVDGEAFDPAGLTVTVNYNDATTEVNPTGVTFTVTPATLVKGQTSVSVTATYNTVSSAPYEVTGLTVNDIPTKTVAEFIAAGGTRCYLEGIVSGLTEGNSMKYGNFDLTDASGTINVYGCLNASGEKEKFAELGVKNGDKIKVIADEYELYGGTKDEAIDVQYVSHISAATITIADITMEVEEVATITPTVDPVDAVVTYTIKENAANAISLSGKTITALAEGTATITATVAEGATYLGNSVDFTVTVGPKTESDEVVILAELDGKWYAMKGAEGSGTGQLAALEVTYFNGTLYNVAEADKASITWTRTIVDGKATFVNNGKYLKGKDGNLSLVTTADNNCEWTSESGFYTTGDNRTFIYRDNYNFKNYSVQNVGNSGYSGFPEVVVPVYATGDVIYTRTVTNGRYGTICLPYGSTEYSGATFFEIAYRETGKVYIDEVTTLEAGVPYIFQANSSTLTVTCEGEAVGDAGSANGLYGTFIKIADVAAEHDDKDEYILTGGFIRMCELNCQVPANRAYIVLDEISTEQTPAPVNRRRVGMSVQGENETTGVEDLFTTESPAKVIENGQLIIIRDGVKYNVQGQKL